MNGLTIGVVVLKKSVDAVLRYDHLILVSLGVFSSLQSFPLSWPLLVAVSLLRFVVVSQVNLVWLVWLLSVSLLSLKLWLSSEVLLGCSMPRVSQIHRTHLIRGVRVHFEAFQWLFFALFVWFQDLPLLVFLRWVIVWESSMCCAIDPLYLVFLDYDRCLVWNHNIWIPLETWYLANRFGIDYLGFFSHFGALFRLTQIYLLLRILIHTGFQQITWRSLHCKEISNNWRLTSALWWELIWLWACIRRRSIEVVCLTFLNVLFFRSVTVSAFSFRRHSTIYLLLCALLGRKRQILLLWCFLLAWYIICALLLSTGWVSILPMVCPIRTGILCVHHFWDLWILLFEMEALHVFQLLPFIWI